MTGKKETLSRLQELGLVAVIRGPSPEVAVRMAAALIAGGVTGIEITYSTPGATGVVETLDRTYGDRILLGMGTLTCPEQAREAQSAGARFLVSPICAEPLGRAMVASGLVSMVGALTPTEIHQAYSLGSDIVKIFPGNMVGPSYVKSLKGPFPYIPLMPTGGVSAANVADWFAAGAFAVGAGSELCPPALAREDRFDEISELAGTFVRAVRDARIGPGAQPAGVG